MTPTTIVAPPMRKSWNPSLGIFHKCNVDAAFNSHSHMRPRRVGLFKIHVE